MNNTTIKSTDLLYTTVITLICLGLVACSKEWFDVKSDKNLTVPSTLQDFEYLLDNHEIISRNIPGLGEIASDGHYITESTWLSFQSDDPISGAQKNAYTWTNNSVYTEVIDWQASYTRISYCNIVLNGLDKLEVSSAELSKFNSIKGNALFQRAKAHFDLSQLFAEHYIPDRNSPFGIPIKSNTDVTENVKRKSVHETYEAILGDLMAASNLLPLRSTFNSRATKLACMGLISRIYLIMGNFELSYRYADSTLRLYNKLMDFNLIDPSVPNLRSNNEEVIFSSVMINYPIIQYGFLLIDDSLYSKYEDDDLRKVIFFQSTADGMVFKGNYLDYDLTATCIATDEIYLTRAESAARLKNTSGALADLRTLLENRYKRNEDGTSTYKMPSIGNENDVLNLILIEREKELLLRGTRWSDLRRLNLDSRFKRTLQRTIGGKEYQIEPNSYKYTFPIPNNEISISNIPQNPGWGK